MSEEAVRRMCEAIARIISRKYGVEVTVVKVEKKEDAA